MVIVRSQVCSKFILKVFVMTNHGKRQFIVWCIYVVFNTVYDCGGSIVCVCVHVQYSLPKFQGFDKPW